MAAWWLLVATRLLRAAVGGAACCAAVSQQATAPAGAVCACLPSLACFVGGALRSAFSTCFLFLCLMFYV